MVLGRAKKVAPVTYLGIMLMAKQEDIGAEVRSINLDDPNELIQFVDDPYSFNALVKLKDNYKGKWRDKIVAFCDTVKDTYNVEHIKQEATIALQFRSKIEKFFANYGLWAFLIVALGILYWIIFNFGTGFLLFAVLATFCGIGAGIVDKNSKKYFSGDTLRIVKDFNKVIK